MVTMTDLRAINACCPGRTFAQAFTGEDNNTIVITTANVRKLRGAIKRVHRARLEKYSYCSPEYALRQAERRIGIYLGVKWGFVAWYLGQCCIDEDREYSRRHYETLIAALCRLVGISEDKYTFNENFAKRLMGCTNDESIAIAAGLNLWLRGLPMPAALRNRG